MKNLILSIVFILSAQNAMARSNTCGALEIGKAIATIDMEIQLLQSGLYDIVRNESMVFITNIVKRHLIEADVCDPRSAEMKARALMNIDTLVINNRDTRPYSIATATRIFNTFKSDVETLERFATGYLGDFVTRQGLRQK